MTDDKDWIFVRIEADVPGQGMVAHEVDYCPLSLFRMGICSLEGSCHLAGTDIKPPDCCPIFPRFHRQSSGRVLLLISLVKRKRWDIDDEKLKKLSVGKLFDKVKKMPRGMYEAKAAILCRLLMQEIQIHELESEIKELKESAGAVGRDKESL